MAKSFNLELQKRPTKQGTYPVWIRITENRKHRRIKTSIEINNLSDWNPNGRPDSKIRKSCEHYAQWNQTLDRELNEVKEFFTNQDNKSASIELLTQEKKNEEKQHSESFLNYAREKVESAGYEQSIGTYRHYQCVFRKIEEYVKSQKRTDISFSEIDKTFVKGFKRYLEKGGNMRLEGRKLEQSTITANIKNLRKLIYEAVDDKKIPFEQCPFGKGKFKVGGTGESKKEKLSEEELLKIMELDLQQGTMEYDTRNAFLFSFCCAGIRVGDLMQLRWKDVEDGEISYKMDKNGKAVHYKLAPEALAILNDYKRDNNKPSDYIFPFLNSNAEWAVESFKGVRTMKQDLQKMLFNQISSKNVLINRSLKKIASEAGIDKHITFHTSRHTFANLGMKTKIPATMMQKLLRHSSVKTTEGYMGSFSNTEASEAISQVLNHIRQNNKDEKQKESLIESLKDLDKETLVSLFTEALMA